ncbi:PKD domain-containing protein [Ureibacillus acetophenoni]|uniref:IPT/TIG domain-containing protein n=1 Tax=Ureibacillus acetophenoni TaxID=614649 RepID=A0A285UNH4_9BACL|nr:IPT/TIG domain protein [Ureibacillus acetophenoni]SOC43267.1 hypothetical protein SAMN05877842_11555 [Ureibacillus acetophenoni]
MPTVGPINALNGFPVWYKDDNGLRLMLNTDVDDPFNIVTRADLPDPSAPISFPDNFPGELFYFTAEAEMRTDAMRARLVLALEAAFVNEIPDHGEQIVFGRVRIRVDGLVAGETYTVTHPYGIQSFVAEDDGDGGGEINFTEDIGGMNGGNFEMALDSKVFPFVTWDPSIEPLAPEGYIGDPTIEHEITGSPVENIFRIQGPGIGIGSPFASPLDPINTIETNLFNVSGKISTISGVEVTRATYTQSDATGGVIDVFAISDVTPQSIQVTGSGLNPTLLVGGNGLYFARVSYEGAEPPSSITVTNLGDNDPTSVQEVEPVDFITAAANYNTITETLTITATSSDSIHEVTLTVTEFDLQLPTTGPLSLLTDIVPANVTIVSSRGGSRTVPVTIDGEVTPPTGVVANAGPDQTVFFGSTVQLNGANSSGTVTSYQWVQISGDPVVTLTGANTSNPTFIAPNVNTSLTFQLTVTGEGGSSSDTVVINVVDIGPPPSANAGLDQTVQQGSLVTLTGSATGVVSTYQWLQISGPTVQLNNVNSATASFTFPNQNATLIFQLTVTGPGGTSTDTVQISSIADVITVTRVQFRTGDSEWRIAGTSNVNGATITIYIGNTLNGTVLAQVVTDALGEWEYRVEPSTVQPDATRAISIQSSSGGVLVNVPINIRN